MRCGASWWGPSKRMVGRWRGPHGATSRPRTAMAPFYSSVCSELGRAPDAALLAEMEATNRGELERLDAAIVDAEESHGDVEVKDALLARAEYLCRIGEKVGPVDKGRAAMPRPLPPLTTGRHATPPHLSLRAAVSPPLTRSAGNSRERLPAGL